MYSIFCDDICIYNDVSVDIGARLIAPTVTWEDNAAGTCTFTMPPTNTGYDKLVLMQSLIVVKKFDKEVWWGRPIKEQKDFWKNRIITCEGCLAFLNDVIQPQRLFEQNTTVAQPPVYNFDGTPEQYLRVILDYHNQNSGYKFNLKKVTVTKYMEDEDDNDEYYEYIVVRTDFKNTLECISEKLTNNEKVGGHIVCYRENGVYQIEYLKDPDEAGVQTIELGKNLLDFTTDYDDSQYCTVLYPRGESLGDSEIQGLTEYLELDPNKDGVYTFEDEDHPDPIELRQKAPRLINEAGVNTYGWIERVMDFSEGKTEDKLLEKAGEWMTKNRFKDMQLEIKAFDLAYMDINYEAIEFMQNIHVISRPHGLDRNFPVLGISIPLDQPQNATYTLGKKKVSTLSTHTSSVTAEVEKNKDWAEIAHTDDFARIQLEIKNRQDAINDAIEQAGEDAAKKIKSFTTGRIGIKQNNYGADALVIIPTLSDSEFADLDIESCTKPMWVWNYEGLGFLQNGWNGTRNPNVAITNDGHIKADRIDAATVNANQINGGSILAGQIDSIYIKAEWIQGGTIVSSQLSDGAITTTKIEGGAITTDKIAANAITANKIAANTITGDKIAAHSITADEINTEGLTVEEAVHAGSVDAEDITGTTISGKTIKSDSSNNYVEVSNGNLWFGANKLAYINSYDNHVEGNILIYADETVGINGGDGIIFFQRPTIPGDGNVATLNDIPSSTVGISASYTNSDQNGIKFSNATTGTGRGATIHYVDQEVSDERLKDDILPLDDMTQTYMRLKPVSFKLKPGIKETDMGIRYGLIAQDVQAVDENLIYEMECPEGSIKEHYCGDRFLNLKYEDLHALHIQMIQQQQKRIEELEKEIKEWKQQNQ